MAHEEPEEDSSNNAGGNIAVTASEVEKMCNLLTQRLSIGTTSSPSTSSERIPEPWTPLPSGPEATANLNWQSGQRSLRQRNACMLNNPLMSDVSFLVGADGQKSRFFGHKYVLSTGSSVFFAMFFGGLAESQETIELPDADPAAFLTLLRYLYCDEMELDDENVLSALYLAKKYLMTHLSNCCVQYLETSLNERNVCLLLSQSQLFDEVALTARCWQVIDAQAELALTSPGFADIDSKTLRSILVRETLNASEVVVFDAVVRWSVAECERRSLSPTAENQRSVIGDMIFLVRIASMSLIEFANGPAQSGILTLKQTNDLFLYFTADQKPEIPFPCTPRKGLKVQICHRFQSSAYRSNQWRYRGRCDSIQFSADKRLFVIGFGLYGSSKGGALYKVHMELKRLGQVLAENATSFFSDGSSSAFPVYFKNAIQIEPEVMYTASVTLDGAELSFFGQDGVSDVCMKGNVNFQFQCSTDSTNGTGVQGGQIPEILFYNPSPASAEVPDVRRQHSA